MEGESLICVVLSFSLWFSFNLGICRGEINEDPHCVLQ
ncbi:hypothetical protein NSU_3875 [Novosphingobium pentaromativorans US6-1]|uniref:Uncharacterized protein n=1 Tax=Novosphingobium pentaromativorans US6-1 TaxID=1088721 RepID=G6EHQ4_9SPHN|nr:hypothetical protein NSU_3875 [Novosphingobium pentaromativorans US6-1]